MASKETPWCTYSYYIISFHIALIQSDKLAKSENFKINRKQRMQYKNKILATKFLMTSKVHEQFLMMQLLFT